MILQKFSEQLFYRAPLDKFSACFCWEEKLTQQTFVGLWDVLKTFSRQVLRTSWRHLLYNNIFSFKTSWRHLQNILEDKKLLRWRNFKMSSRPVLETSSRHVLKISSRHNLKMSSRPKKYLLRRNIYL